MDNVFTKEVVNWYFVNACLNFNLDACDLHLKLGFIYVTLTKAFKISIALSVDKYKLTILEHCTSDD